MGLLDLLSGFQAHPSVPHVFFRVKQNREAYDLSFKCKACGETLEWKCHNPGRAQGRIDTWARMHAHGVKR
jgi:hypothetical protein